MMAGPAQWVVPLVLGLVAAGAAYGLDQLPDAPPAPQSEHPSLEPVATESPLVFGVGNVSTAQLTLLVFKLDDGHLLASNADEDEIATLVKDGDFQALGPVALHVGNATLPPGSFRLPASLRSFEAAIADNLTGHRAGDVVEVRVDDYPWLDIFGPLRIVARVEALVPPVAAPHAI